MTLTDLLRRTYRRVKLPDTPPSADRNRILDYVNLWYRTVLSRPGMERLRDTTLTLNTVATQKKYGLPQAISVIRDMYDQTNQRRLQPRTVDYLRNVDPGLTATSSTIENWIPLNGWGAELVELTSTGVGLWVQSDSASDTTQKVFIEGTRLGGVRGGTVGPTSVNGVTRVQIGTLTDYVEVVKFYTDTVAIGNLSLYDAAVNGNLLSTIQIGKTSARYLMVQFYPTPGAVITVSVDCQRAIEDLTNPTEPTLIPEDYDHCLVHFAAGEEWMNRTDDRYKTEFALAERIVNDLRHSISTSADEIAVQRGPRGIAERYSRLGGQFPAGS